MRRYGLVLLASALALPAFAAPASAAAFQSCGPVTMAGFPKALAVKVKVKGLSCAEATSLWTSYVSTGEALPPPLGDLTTSCRDGSKAARKKASKVGRLAIVCRDGKLATTAWVLGG